MFWNSNALNLRIRRKQHMALTQLQIDELIERDRTHSCGGEPDECVHLAAIADLPTRFGQFQVAAFYNNIDHEEHAAFIKGDVCGATAVPVRLHSECLTGDAIGSLRCDCRDQLEAALHHLAGLECGILLYLRQEGRGIGFTNKIKAYGLQDQGYDTVEANEALGLPDDARDYEVAAHMLRALDVRSVRLMTNNPRKIAGLESHGIDVVERIPHVMVANDFNRRYLETKAIKSGHLIDFDEQAEPIGGAA